MTAASPVGLFRSIALPEIPADSPHGPPTQADAEAEPLRLEQDAYLDEALMETFPASDPIAPGRPHSASADPSIPSQTTQG